MFLANSRSPLQEEYDSESDHRSRTSVSSSSLCSWRALFGERRTIQRRTSLCCSSDLRPRTTNLVSCSSLLQLATCILQPILCSFRPPTSHLQPRSISINSATDLAHKSRCTLKIKHPLFAGKNSSKCHVASCKTTNEIGG